MENYFLSFLLIVFLLGSLYIAFIWSKKKTKLTTAQLKFYSKILKNIETHPSSKEKILECDKLYHKILLNVGYHGTFGDILKQHPRHVSDINTIWELHKIRNKLAHDFDQFDETYLIQKSKQYVNECKKLLENQ